MLISSLRLERKAKKAFREEPSDTEDTGMDFPNRFCEKYPQLAIKNQVCDESQDLQYMGGQAEKNKKGSGNGRKQKQGCFEKFMSLSGSGQNNFGKSDPKTDWESMSAKEQEDRVEQLWVKARRYNNKLRF
jgi:hypothetical protein